MGGTLKPFDPALGRQFESENGGLIVLRGKATAPPREEMPYGLDAQQQHDWLREHPDAEDPTVAGE